MHTQMKFSNGIANNLDVFLCVIASFGPSRNINSDEATVKVWDRILKNDTFHIALLLNRSTHEVQTTAS